MTQPRSPVPDHDAQHRALVDYAASILRDRAAAEDVVQSAWLALVERAGDAAILDRGAYLRRSVRNAAIDHLRRRTRLGMVRDDAGAVDAIADETPSPEADAIARHDLRCVMAALAALPDRQRRAIEFYRLDGLKLREIAELLGVSIPLVHALIADGLAACARRCGLAGVRSDRR